MTWPGDESETNGIEQGAHRRSHLQITWIMVLQWTAEKKTTTTTTEEEHEEEVSSSASAAAQ